MFGFKKNPTGWYVSKPNQAMEGPLELSKIIQRIAAGFIVSDTMVTTDRKNFVRAADAFPTAFAHSVARENSGKALVLDADFDAGDAAPAVPAVTFAGPVAGVPPPQTSNAPFSAGPFSASPPPPPPPRQARPGDDDIVIDMTGLTPNGAGVGTVTPPPQPPPAPIAMISAPTPSNFPETAPISAPLVERYKPGPFKHGDPETCTCPHCLTVFPLEDALYIAGHPDLLGDPFLGVNAVQRFKPTRFTPDGQAIDPGGMPSLDMACPNCHLPVPRCLTEFRPLYLSVIGAPRSGKSYLLATLTWELRQTLNNEFGFAFTDADASMNISLQQNEEKLFLAQDPNEFARLAKTQADGDDYYNAVNFNGQRTLYPKPFVFSLRALDHNPVAENPLTNARSIILYDNAGEHFQPGSEQVNAPTTQHMARSDSIFYVFDPTKDPRFRSKVKSQDPQVQAGAELQRQDTIINEIARRTRRYLGISQRDKYQGLFVVIVGKMDVWSSMLSIPLRNPPFIQSQKHAVMGLDIGHVEDVSFSLRALLQKVCPDVVAAAEDFAADVAYIPVSAQGCSPTPVTTAGDTFYAVRPSDIKPVWVTVPFLYALARKGLLLAGASRPADAVAANLLRRAGGFLFCEVPTADAGAGAPMVTIQVPEKYAGRTLHHPVTGKPFVVPKPE